MVVSSKFSNIAVQRLHSFRDILPHRLLDPLFAQAQLDRFSNATIHPPDVRRLDRPGHCPVLIDVDQHSDPVA